MKILVAPLDWGLGHAARCIPIIREFLNSGATVELSVVASNAKFLRGFFPNLRQRIAPSYNIIYPKHGYNMGLWLIKNAIHLKQIATFEHNYVEALVKKNGYDIIFSDNRFGFYSTHVKSIYMTHQLRIAFPKAFTAFEEIGKLWHAHIIKNFNEIWIPDLPTYPGYAGKLSHVTLNTPTRFIGALSRFSNIKKVNNTQQYTFVAIVSGVEPARGRFETLLKNTLQKIPGKHAIILGKPSIGIRHWQEGNIDLYTHAPDEIFIKLVQSSKWVISRGGYSTIMDLAFLETKNIFVPTPGQYEQIILAQTLKSFAICIYEHEFCAQKLIDATNQINIATLPKPSGDNLLKNAIKETLKDFQKDEV